MPGKRFAFVLRIWAEEAGSESPGPIVWRGSLHTPDEGQVRYFSSLERLVEILSTLSGWEEDVSPER